MLDVILSALCWAVAVPAVLVMVCAVLALLGAAVREAVR